MPNWCENVLYIKGPLQTLVPIFESIIDINDEVGFLENLMPIGKWNYGTAVEEWGTKWDVDDSALEFKLEGDGMCSIEGVFNSAWSPPIAALNTFCTNNQATYAKLYYYEPGLAFTGKWTSEDEDEYYEFSEATSSTIEDIIPEDIDDMFGISESLKHWEESQEE